MTVYTFDFLNLLGVAALVVALFWAAVVVALIVCAVVFWLYRGQLMVVPSRHVTRAKKADPPLRQVPGGARPYPADVQSDRQPPVPQR